jgi:hypothetical protein
MAQCSELTGLTVNVPTIASHRTDKIVNRHSEECFENLCTFTSVVQIWKLKKKKRDSPHKDTLV